MQRPHHSVPTSRRMECPQPVDEPLASRHAHRRLTRDATPETPERSRANNASPAASSSALRDPVSPSQAATPLSPCRTRSCFSAADDSQPLNDTPSSLAAVSTADATSSSSETDRLVTTSPMVTPQVLPGPVPALTRDADTNAGPKAGIGRAGQEADPSFDSFGTRWREPVPALTVAPRFPDFILGNPNCLKWR